MTNTKLFLLLGTSLSFLPQTLSAQCVSPIQDCYALGYTQTSCPNGKGVKCPFGNGWYCGGTGAACGDKYQSCTCASGYEWKDGGCQQQLNGAQGELFYCNGTVVGIKTSGMNFYIAMQDLGTMNWNNANSQCSNYTFCNNLKGSLPSKDQLLTIYNNKSQLNSLLSINNGGQFAENWYWSSTFNTADYNYYAVGMYNGKVYDYYHGSASGYARPILTSW